MYKLNIKLLVGNLRIFLRCKDTFLQHGKMFFKVFLLF